MIYTVVSTAATDEWVLGKKNHLCTPFAGRPEEGDTPVRRRLWHGGRLGASSPGLALQMAVCCACAAAAVLSSSSAQFNYSNRQCGWCRANESTCLLAAGTCLLAAQRRMGCRKWRQLCTLVFRYRLYSTCGTGDHSRISCCPTALQQLLSQVMLQQQHQGCKTPAMRSDLHESLREDANPRTGRF